MNNIAKGRIAYLDGVRAVAILAVIGVHWINPYITIAPGGYIGVDIFFVLSGYIITRILWRGSQSANTSKLLLYKNFMIQRVRRLYPALSAFVLLGVVIASIMQPSGLQKYIHEGLIAEIQGMAIYLGLGGDGTVPFGHTWSLANEWFFYLIWPVFLLWASKRKCKPTHIAVMTIVVAVVLYGVSFPSSPAWFYFGPPSRAAQILAGAAAALLIDAYTNARLNRTPADVLTALGLVATISWIVFGSHEFDPLYRSVGYPLAVLAALCLIVPCALSPQCSSVRLLSTAPLPFLGRISYSLYLWHLFPLQILDKDLMPGLPFPAIAAIGVFIAAIFTLTSYFFLERPFTRPRPTSLSR